MINSAKQILAIKSLLPFYTPVADPCCTAIAAWLVTTLCKIIELYRAEVANANARALDRMLRWSGDHDFDAAIGAGSFA